MTQLPKMVRIRQHFDTRPIVDVAAAVDGELTRIGVERIVSAGQTVAITAGSRGIANLAEVIAAIVRRLKTLGAEPFVVPAMGSHGGATAEGQARVLAHYGVTEAAVGAPVKSSMEVVQVGATEDGLPVWVDRHAQSADHVVVVNRVKPHTDFQAEVESGLIKMMAIGLGKQKGADTYHNAIIRHGHYRVLTAVARVVLSACPVAFGVALVENQREQTAIVRAAAAADIEATERRLLEQARALFPRLPFAALDLLIVDRMGKNISGTGMDQNVIGRTVVSYHQVAPTPEIMRIFVRDLTPESDGNAVGIGNADFTTRRLVEKIDRHATYMNCITSGAPEIVRIPAYYDTDRQALEAALNTIGPVPPQKARIVHIADTLRLEEMNVSAALLPEVERLAQVSVAGEPFEMPFDAQGNLVSELAYDHAPPA